MIESHELIIDNFAGGGGASEGMEIAFGRHVDIAINHDPKAIAMHKVNHPKTKHYCESVWDVDPVEACAGKRVGFAWFSPDCKHFSKARGKTPVDKNIRGLAWIVLRWGLLTDMRSFTLENVQEFKTWGPVIGTQEFGKYVPDPERKGETFDGFVKMLTTGICATHPAFAEACHYLEIQNNPELKQKLIRGLGYDVEFKSLIASHYGAPTSRERFFMVARKDGQALNWPEQTHGQATGLKPFKTAADCIDWSIPTKSIFGRKKALADNTLKRIAKGIQRFVIDDPNPFIIRIGQTGFGGDRLSWGLDRPLTTITSKNEHILVTSNIIKLRKGNIGHKVDEPLHTITSGGLHHGEVRGFFLKYYGTNVGHRCDQPLQTITTKDRFALVTIKGEDYQVLDIGMRMLEPHELFKAQGFRDSYIIDVDENGKPITKKDQVARCGNSVPPPFATALVKANFDKVAVEVAA